MRIRPVFFCLFVTATAFAQPVPQLIRGALAADPAIAGAMAQIRAAEQRLVQARAAFGPTASLGLSQSFTRYTEAPEDNVRKFKAKQAALQVTQPLYRAPLFSALDAAEAQLAQAEAGLRQARADSMQRLVEASFEVLKARDALALTQAQGFATTEQLAAARKSFKVGTAPVTDVREAEAKADTVSAQLGAARFELDLRQQVLAEIAGMPAPGLLERGLDGQRLPPVEARALPDWLGSALAGNAQLSQAEFALAIARAEVEKAERAHAPTIDLNYSYTASSDTGTVTTFFPRRGDASQIGVNLNIPLFASGATQAKVGEAVALQDKAQSDVDTARRTVTLGVRQSFSALLSAIGQARGLETAVTSQELALRANRRGYEVGLKINAEVLESQSRLFEARRDLSRARYDAWLNYIKLKALAGSLNDADAELLDAVLVPMADAPQDATRRNGATR